MDTGTVTKSLHQDWTKLGLYEYLLVAHPDASVNNKIIDEKQNFYNNYKHKTAVSTKPHITVAGFLAKEAMEETIMRYVQRICAQQQSFDVMLNNYSGYPPHTIYVRVQNPQPFRQLATQLKAVSNYIDSCSCPPANLITNPHITIARNLNENVYLKALMEFGQKTFHAIFTVNELMLLRRAHQFDACKTINVFGLQPPGNTLFN
jgi:2'-5' RNA ligase